MRAGPPIPRLLAHCCVRLQTVSGIPWSSMNLTGWAVGPSPDLLKVYLLANCTPAEKASTIARLDAIGLGLGSNVRVHTYSLGCFVSLPVLQPELTCCRGGLGG